MPQVPYSPVPTARPGNIATPAVRIDTPGAAFGTNIGEAQENLGHAEMAEGQAIQGVGDVFAKQALARQGLANETAAKEGDFNFAKASGDLYAKYGSTEGKNAVAAYPQFQKDLEDLRQQQLQSMPNDAARKMLDQSMTRSAGFMIREGARHAAQQDKVYGNQVSAARTDMAVQRSAQFFNDDEEFKTNLGTIKSEQVAQAEQNGWAPEVLQDNINKKQSAAWQARLTQMALHEPYKAQQYYLANKDKIDGSNQVAIEQHLKSALDSTGTRTAADAIISGRPFVAPDTLVKSLKVAESGDRPGLTSSAGALGVMQVMPETGKAVAKRLGIEYDENKLKNDREYNERIGTTYLNDMLARYGGNQTLAVAAYNAGPGKVDKWLSTIGDPRSGAMSNVEWASKIPIAETKAYVSKVLDGTSGGTAIAAFDPAKGPGQLTPMLAEAKRTAAFLAPGDAQFADQLEARVRSHVSLGMAQWTDTQHQNLETVQAAIIGQVAQSGSISVDQITGPTADPKVRQAFNELASDKQKTVLGAIHTQQNQATPGRLALFDRLMGQAKSNPASFLDESILDKDLTLADKKTLLSEQNKIRNRNDTTSHLNKLLSSAKPVLNAAGVRPGGAAGSDEAIRYDKFIGSFNRQVQDYEALNKKSPDEEWVRKTTAGMLRQEQADWGVLSGVARAFGVKSDRAFERDVPKEAQSAIVEQYSKQFGATPSADQVKNIWLRSQVAMP